MAFIDFVKALEQRGPEEAKAFYDRVTETLFTFLGLRLDEIEAAPMRHIWRYMELASKALVPPAELIRPDDPSWDLSIINPPPVKK